MFDFLFFRKITIKNLSEKIYRLSVLEYPLKLRVIYNKSSSFHFIFCICKCIFIFFSSSCFVGKI